ncbi:MAG: hypothetical protein WAT27_07805 [Chitinophagales bacterium]
MKPVTFKEANMKFVAPADQPQVGDLPAFVGNNQEGSPVIISKWELSEEEVQQIVANKSIYLVVSGQGMPPLSMHTETVFSPIELEEKPQGKIIKLG